MIHRKLPDQDLTEVRRAGYPRWQMEQIPLRSNFRLDQPGSGCWYLVPAWSGDWPALASARPLRNSFRRLTTCPPKFGVIVPLVPIEVERRKSISRDKSAALAYGGLGMILAWRWVPWAASRGVRRERASRPRSQAWWWARPPVPEAPYSFSPRITPLGQRRPKTILIKTLPWRCERTERSGSQSAPPRGLALGLGLGGGANVARAMIGGILGAALAAAIYEFAGAIAFPLAQTFRPMAADVVPRLMAQLSVALCVAAGAFGAARHLRLQRAAPRRALTRERA